MFESIKSIRPHFHSLREIQENVSLDIKLPLTWNYENVIKPYRSIGIKIQDKNEKFTLLSLISSATQEGYNVVFACALEIINHNREEEEKQRLYNEKLKELQELFKNGSLDKLKDINLLEDYGGQKNITSDGLVTEGSGEGQEGDRDGEDEND